jgi:hypothetical protein
VVIYKDLFYPSGWLWSKDPLRLFFWLPILFIYQEILLVFTWEWTKIGWGKPAFGELCGFWNEEGVIITYNSLEHSTTWPGSRHKVQIIRIQEREMFLSVGYPPHHAFSQLLN